ncbi:MAG: hypothetical protein ACHQFW_03365 [Chitinophagales bacterium]
MKQSNLIRIKAWLLVGTLDLLSACIHYYIKTGDDPSVILPYIASAIFGASAYQGGLIMYLAGFCLHYLNAFIFTIIFFWLYPKLKFFSKSKILTGILYGLFIWLVMNLIVVPNTRIPHRPWVVESIIINALILIIAIGIPLSIIASNYYKKIHRKK